MCMVSLTVVCFVHKDLSCCSCFVKTSWSLQQFGHKISYDDENYTCSTLYQTYFYRINMTRYYQNLIGLIKSVLLKRYIVAAAGTAVDISALSLMRLTNNQLCKALEVNTVHGSLINLPCSGTAAGSFAFFGFSGSYVSFESVCFSDWLGKTGTIHVLDDQWIAWGPKLYRICTSLVASLS